jgi:hypothetical protein
MNKRFTIEQERIINEIQRVAKKLRVSSLSKSQFDEHHELGGVTTAGMQFGSWNEAVTAAGLDANPPGGNSSKKLTDDELLREIIRIHELLGREPSERQMAANARFSMKPYRDRWENFTKAREEAYSNVWLSRVNRTSTMALTLLSPNPQ